MMRLLWLGLILAGQFLIPAPIKASASPVYAAPADWVNVTDLASILDEKAGSEAILVMIDQQLQLQPGHLYSYQDVAIRIDSAKTMSSMAQLFTPSWHPDHGDLIIHRFEIVRAGEGIDLMTSQNVFQVIRRERNLERQMINGMLTAFSQLEDLQLGDVVRLSYTITQTNDALDGRVQTSRRFLNEDVNIDFLRQTVRWPVDMEVNWRVSKDEIVPTRQTLDGWNILEFDYRAPQLDVEIPDNAPMRFRDANYFEAASFRSWEDVWLVNDKLYPEEDGIVPGGELDLVIKAIAEQTDDKKERMALALRLVQDQIRYLFNGMGFGNYEPQTPEETWRLRYGDCKAKTYLLLAALRRLGIGAEPMLVHINQRDAVADRLPSLQAFNHIIVRAELDGLTYWLDGTDTGTRKDDLQDSPTFRFGLTEQGLEEIPIRKPGRPYQKVNVTYDLKAGVDLPAPFELYAELRDSEATEIKEAISQLSAERAKEVAEEVALDYVLDGLVTETQFTYDDELQTGFLAAKGLAYLSWSKKGQRRRHELWSPANTFSVQKSRDEEELRDLPVTLSFPRFFEYNVTYILPEKYQDAELTGQTSVSAELGGYQLERDITKTADRLVSKEYYFTDRWELPANQFELERQQISDLNRRKVALVLPEDAPGPWHEIDRYVVSGGVKAHEEAFNAHVANATDDQETALANRAYFFEVIGNYEAAIQDLEASLELNSDPANYKWLGDLQLGSSPADAKASYARAIALSPTYYEALLALTRVHIRLLEFDQAHALLDQAKANGLTNTNIDSLRIEVLQAEGQFDEALTVMDGLVEEEPESAAYLADRCLIRMMEARDLDLALEDCTNMIEIAKRSAYYHFLRALVHYRMGNYQLARADLDKSIRAGDSNSYAYKLRSATHSKLGNTRLAKDDLMAAEYFDPAPGWYWGLYFDMPWALQ